MFIATSPICAQEFEPIDVKQDKRLDLVADVSGGRVARCSPIMGPTWCG